MNIQHWGTKKNILTISGIISVTFTILNLIGTFQLCGGKNYGDCMVLLHDFLVIFIVIIPLFLFSLITYKMRDEIYATWLRFVKWWIPFSMLLVLIAPHNKGDWMFPHDKGRVSFSMAVIFAIVSLLIIAYKSFQLRKK